MQHANFVYFLGAAAHRALVDVSSFVRRVNLPGTIQHLRRNGYWLSKRGDPGS
jgi:hypothetical protein